MPQTHGEVTQAAGGRAVIRFEPASCAGCRGCGHTVSREVALDTGASGFVKVSLSTPALLSILLNSLGYPLAGFVIAASIATMTEAGELFTAFLSMAGFCVGILCCRRQTEERIEIEEVLDD